MGGDLVVFVSSSLEEVQKISAEAAANREVVAICQMLVTYQLTCVLLAVCDRALQLQECECSASD